MNQRVMDTVGEGARGDGTYRFGCGALGADLDRISSLLGTEI
jgi:hypothetical protein